MQYNFRRRFPVVRKTARTKAEPALDVSRGRLYGKVAVVTGASRGIGLAIAEALAGEECNLAISARQVAHLEAVAPRLKKYGSKVLAHACEVRQPESVARFFSAIEERFTAIDILINNAGIAHPTLEAQELPLETWREVIEVNLTGTFLCTRAALPLIRRGGVIVNNLSVAAKGMFPGGAAYNASKWGALGFTNTLREELRERGIRVLALMPGATHTDMWPQNWPEAPRERMIAPESVASAVLNAVLMPANTSVEEITLGPAGGAL
jgi:NAD(P)-dependent dehydrogenase (short-subunit alcohol dehydrogenase family)